VVLVWLKQDWLQDCFKVVNSIVIKITKFVKIVKNVPKTKQS
jgi:hypothetical protein